jgi:hypothetical protein
VLGEERELEGGKVSVEEEAERAHLSRRRSSSSVGGRSASRKRGNCGNEQLEPNAPSLAFS